MSPIKSSLAKSVSKLLGVFKDTDLSLRGDVQISRRIIPPLQASGGTKTTSGDYTIHTFSYPTSDNFEVTQGEGEIDILVIAAGGAGGSGGPSGWYGGGGGAGGYVYVTGYSVTSGTYDVSVGQGGTGNGGGRGSDGADSTFNAPAPNADKILAKGGGGGGDGSYPGVSPEVTGNPGGSGGGAGAHLPSTSSSGGTALQPSQNPGFSNGTLEQYGYAGGNEAGGTGDGRGGGGGGAGAAGQSSPGGSPNGGGGAGRANSISGSSVTYAGGAPTQPSDPHPAPGVAGSGGAAAASSQTGGSGQPGIVIVRYLT